MIAMPLNRKNFALRACTVLIFAQGIFASSTFAETRHHDAHVHGEGKLNIALAGKELHMELEIPAANVVGFEHAPGNAKEKEAVHKAEEDLKDGGTLFVLTKQAKCKLVAAKVEQDMLKDEHSDEEHHDHDGHDEHAHHEHKDEEHHDHDNHEGESAHSEFHAQYQFTCEKPEKLKDIDVKLFSVFSGFEKIDVQMLTPKGQTAIQLTAKKHQITL